jgi:hypothetical protein
MSAIDDACEALALQLREPWSAHVSGPERVWILTYRPSDERRLRFRLKQFETTIEAAGKKWQLIDLTASFERWLDGHEYRDEYLADPESLQFGAVDEFADHLAADVHVQLAAADDQTVSTLLGAASLFGLVRLSRLIAAIADQIPGRMLVMFPGVRDDNNYRLLDGHDGWNYLAVPVN